MIWLNILTSMLRSPAFVGSSPVERATWLSVIAYCVEQENGGRILNGLKWKDRQWQQTCGVTAREVRNADKLLTIEGDDVIIFAYPLEKEEEVRAKRIQAGDAARKRWDTQLGTAPRNASGNTPRIAPRNAEGEWNGREENGKTIAPASPPRAKNPLFDALARACGSDPTQMTDRASRACGVALAEIRKASPNITEADFQPRAARYRQIYRDAAFTPSALCAHWAELGTNRPATVASTQTPEPADWRTRLLAACPDNVHSADVTAWQHKTRTDQQNIIDALQRAEK
jgi:hypothetical protein